MPATHVNINGRWIFTPEYNAWMHMRLRCNNPSDNSYKNYGARGITVCVGWEFSYSNFYSDVGPRPSKRHSLERLDNSGHYSCGSCEECQRLGRRKNVRWATRQEQNRNKRNNVWHTENGQTLCVKDWCRIKGLNPGIVYSRLSRGWSVADALNKPLRQW